MTPTFPAELVRDDLRDFTGYSSARTSHSGPPARIWLNANEAAGPSTADPGGTHRRYPDPQPPALVAALASLYGVPDETVVVGRGSDEAIELLVRATCRPGADAVVVAPPTFGMYAVSARLHGVPVVEVPQQEARDRDGAPCWQVDVDALVAAARDAGARLVFVASPGNPTGATVPQPGLVRLATALARQAVVVVDEAYQEFASGPGAVPLLADHPNLAVLRTLSKAHGLAAARVGTCLAHPDLAAVLRRVQAPYPLPGPVTALALEALRPEALAATAERVEQTVRERTHLARALAAEPTVTAVYPGQANFVLVRSTAPDALLTRLRAAGIVVRDLRHQPGLHDALRITVGSPDEVDAVAATLRSPTDDPAPVTDPHPVRTP